MNSPDYGRLTLQKTGVAARDPSTGDVTGWVVSFNVVKADDPTRYERFHENHRTQIQALLYRREHTSATRTSKTADDFGLEPEWPNSARIADWIRNGCESPKLTVADSYAQKQRCFDFCASVMIGDKRRYGLESVEYLDEWFFDFNSAEYILMRSPEGDLVGVCRIHMNRHLGFCEYSGLDEWVTRAVEDNQTFADIGAYLHPLVEGRSRTSCVAKLLGHAARIAERNEQVHLYAQVPSYLAKLFETFLFRRAGAKFKCRGWRQPSWTPIASKCIVYSDDGETAEWPKPENADDEFVGDARREYHNELEKDQQVV